MKDLICPKCESLRLRCVVYHNLQLRYECMACGHQWANYYSTDELEAMGGHA